MSIESANLSEDWPRGSMPLFEAVFEQPYSEGAKRLLSNQLAPWRYGASGERIGAGVLDHPPYRLIATRVSFQARTFRYRWRNEGLESRPTEGLSIAPPLLIEGRLRPKSAVFDLLSPEGVQALIRAAAFVWTRMTDDFDQRIRSGELTLYARIGSPLGPVQPISPDAWEHFNRRDWNQDTALCETSNETLYSVHALEALDFAAQAEPVTAPRRTPTQTDHDELVAEATNRAQSDGPMTEAEMCAWGRSRGISREAIRKIRKQIPPSIKRARGQKKADPRPG